MSITEKLLSSKNALSSLLTFANAKTGKSDPDIGEAIRTLVDGYGQGGGGDFWDAEGDIEQGQGTATLTIPYATQSRNVLFHAYNRDSAVTGGNAYEAWGLVVSTPATQSQYNGFSVLLLLLANGSNRSGSASGYVEGSGNIGNYQVRFGDTSIQTQCYIGFCVKGETYHWSIKELDNI